MGRWGTSGSSTRGTAHGSHQWQRESPPARARCTPGPCSQMAACWSLGAAALQARSPLSLKPPQAAQKLPREDACCIPSSGHPLATSAWQGFLRKGAASLDEESGGCVCLCRCCVTFLCLMGTRACGWRACPRLTFCAATQPSLCRKRPQRRHPTPRLPHPWASLVLIASSSEQAKGICTNKSP